MCETRVVVCDQIRFPFDPSKHCSKRHRVSIDLSMLQLTESYGIKVFYVTTSGNH